MTTAGTKNNAQSFESAKKIFFLFRLEGKKLQQVYCAMHVSWNQGLPPGYDIVLKRACTFTKLAGCQGWSSGEKKRIEVWHGGA